MPVNKREKPEIIGKDLSRLNKKIKKNNESLKEKRKSILRKLHNK